MSHGGGGNCIRRAVKKNRAAMRDCPGANERCRCFSFEHSRRRDRLDFARKEKRLRISISERLQHFVPAQKIDIDLGERQLMIESQARLQMLHQKEARARHAKCFGKAIEIFLAQRKPAAISCPPNFSSVSAQRVQRFDQVQSFDASSASLADAVLVETDHNCGPMIFASNPRRHDAQHARMPAARARPRWPHHAPRRIDFRSVSIAAVEDFLFDFLAFAILLVEFCREQPSLRFHPVSATGAKISPLCSNGPQRSIAGPAGNQCLRAKLADALRRLASISSDRSATCRPISIAPRCTRTRFSSTQRHDVRHRAERHKVELRFQIELRQRPRLQQRVTKFENDSRRCRDNEMASPESIFGFTIATQSGSADFGSW